MGAVKTQTHKANTRDIYEAMARLRPVLVGVPKALAEQALLLPQRLRTLIDTGMFPKAGDLWLGVLPRWPSLLG